MLPWLARAKAKHKLAPVALAMLGVWDGRMARDRAEPTIYAAWLRQMHIKLYADELTIPAKSAQEKPVDLFGAYRSEEVSFLLLALNYRPIWCDDIRTPAVETCEDVIGAALDAALEELSAKLGGEPRSWLWGSVHQAQFRHRVFGAVPGIGALANVAIPVDGGMHTLNRAHARYSDARSPFAAIHGATFRAVYDFSELDNSRFIMPLGQSGNPLSPWYDHLTKDWAKFNYIFIRGSEEQLRRAGIGTIELRPR
jgi:penicillin G amidase